MRSPVALCAIVAVLLFHILSLAEPARAAVASAAVVPCRDVNDPPRTETTPTTRVSTPAPVEPVPLPPPLEGEEKLFDAEAYRDVYYILRGENPCSRFFGGAVKALEVFNSFASRLESRPFGNERIVLQMEGRYTRFNNAQTGASYRIFERAAINSTGPFYRRAPGHGRERLKVGKFPAHTRQARALVLLHELGHLVEGEGGEWLLPNDGNDPALSERNTRKVEDKCLEEIKALEE